MESMDLESKGQACASSSGASSHLPGTSHHLPAGAALMQAGGSGGEECVQGLPAIATAAAGQQVKALIQGGPCFSCGITEAPQWRRPDPGAGVGACSPCCPGSHLGGLGVWGVGCCTNPSRLQRGRHCEPSQEQGRAATMHRLLHAASAGSLHCSLSDRLLGMLRSDATAKSARNTGFTPSGTMLLCNRCGIHYMRYKKLPGPKKEVG